MDHGKNVPVPPVTPSQEMEDRSALKRKREFQEDDLNATKRACYQTPNNDETSETTQFWTDGQLRKLYPEQTTTDLEVDLLHEIGAVQTKLTEMSVSKDSPLKASRRSLDELLDQSIQTEMAGFRSTSSPVLKTPSISPISGTSPQSSPEIIDCMNDAVQEDNPREHG